MAQPLDVARARLGIARPTLYEAVPQEARNGYRFNS
jgi:ubiquinone biosynthesis protein COQ4